MMLIEQTTVPGVALPVQVMKDHLRLGTGFSDDGMQDVLIESYLRAAIGVIEGRIGKALLARRFRWTLEGWRGAKGLALPVAPVSEVVSVTLFDMGGVGAVVDPARVRLMPDMHRPRLTGVGGSLPVVPTEGRVEVVFDAGFGTTWDAVPADLGQAVILLSAEYYEQRHMAGAHEGGLPFGVQALIERWRTVRVLGGGAA